MLETPVKLQVLANGRSENPVNRDNQQIIVLPFPYSNGILHHNAIDVGCAMTNEAEAAWLAGFLDADGMIRLKTGRKNKVKHKGVGPKSLVPLVSYCGTCALTMKRIAEKISAVFPGGDYSPSISAGRFQLFLSQQARHCPKWDIDIGGITRVLPFLRFIRPHLVTKAAEADLMLMFCELRLRKGREPYGTLEYQIAEAIKYLKTTRHLRDYMPSAEQVLSEDIVRSNAEVLEAAEMSARLPIEARREWARNLVADYRWNKAGHGK